MTALRHSMRAPKKWQTILSHKSNREIGIALAERDSTVEEDIKDYISKSELDYLMSKDNKQTALL
jgi:putative membrane protein